MNFTHAQVCVCMCVRARAHTCAHMHLCVHMYFCTCMFSTSGYHLMMYAYTSMWESSIFKANQKLKRKWHKKLLLIKHNIRWHQKHFFLKSTNRKNPIIPDFWTGREEFEMGKETNSTFCIVRIITYFWKLLYKLFITSSPGPLLHFPNQQKWTKINLRHKPWIILTHSKLARTISHC